MSPRFLVSWGLSPRVRGNQRRDCTGRAQGRSIPACTGKPHASGSAFSWSVVYPRVYGETGRGVGRLADGPGLSPRVRGNRRCTAYRRRSWGSIPACTGKPVRPAATGRSGSVYPRVYGETLVAGTLDPVNQGLSPRVRGNPRSTISSDAGIWSIPACTGKPMFPRLRNVPCTVYPRVYGETMRPWERDLQSHGLSPRVRGNPSLEIVLLAQSRSIPACTGKPPFSRYIRHDLDGSIPACTGKPCSALWGSPPTVVYPRVYGETQPSPIGGHHETGLSPRVRGNHQI